LAHNYFTELYFKFIISSANIQLVLLKINILKTKDMATIFTPVKSARDTKIRTVWYTFYHPYTTFFVNFLNTCQKLRNIARK